MVNGAVKNEDTAGESGGKPVLLRFVLMKNHAPFPHTTTRGSVTSHYHTRLRPDTLPQEAPFPHITTRGSVTSHYHTRLRPNTLPQEAPSSHITTRGSIPTHYHMRLRPHTLPHVNLPPAAEAWLLTQGEGREAGLMIQGKLPAWSVACSMDLMVMEKLEMVAGESSKPACYVARLSTKVTRQSIIKLELKICKLKNEIQNETDPKIKLMKSESLDDCRRELAIRKENLAKNVNSAQK
ncbi:unnamed protein product, partial [Ranitomeya imitator]